MADVRQDELGQDDQTIPTPAVNGTASGTDADPDAQALLISSLRAQIQDLFSQVTQLNGKLVKSYDRVSDLEDDLHVASANLRTSSVKISQLELERSQHLSALNTGLLVEKSHVTSELTRLMEKATEEAAQRGQAESARNAIEKDLDDLSANLFDQANTMVAEARFARSLSERKVEEAEAALRGAEEAVASMQKQMQIMQAEKDEAESRAREMQVTVGKGKWAARPSVNGHVPTPMHLLSTHVPYQEFLLFVAHLRSLHPSSPTPPAMSTLLPLPFLARILNEDSDPTVRLDLAPSLNWLTRRSVLAAIHTGQLTIEPMPSASLLHDPNLPGATSNISNANCALCGTAILTNNVPSSPGRSAPPLHPLVTGQNITSIFKRQQSISRPETPSQINGSPTPTPPQIYVFRVTTTITHNATPPSSGRTFSISNLPSTSGSVQPPQHPTAQHQTTTTTTSSSTTYPLCTNGWCLARLRSTCILWAFVRTGIVEKIWEEEAPNLPSPEPLVEKPPVPPRRRGLWGMATALGERAASWGEGDKGKAPLKQKILPATPPPQHPTLKEIAAPTPSKAPPLPKRNQSRAKTPQVPGSSDSASAPPVPERRREEPKADDSTSEPEVDVSNPVEQVPERSGTPTKVPLPDSRPATPGPPVVVDSPQATSSPASNVPPPIPRRAAARGARPLSTSGLSRPSTPSQLAKQEDTTPIAAAQSGDDVKADEDATPKAGEEVIPKPEPEPAPSEAREKSEGADTSDYEEAPESPSASVLVSAALSNPASHSNGTSEETTETYKASETTDPSATARASTGTSDFDSVSDQKTVGVNGVTVNGHSEFEDEKDNGESQDHGPVLYIGDATWEERTWKELVRLKEEMFWARMGGLRP